MTNPSPATVHALVLSGVLWAPAAWAQSALGGQDAATDDAAKAPVVVGAREIGGPIEPIRIDVDVRTLPAPREWEPGDSIKEIPRRAYPQPGYREPVLPDTPPDPLLALQPVPPLRAPDDFDVPLVSIDAQNFTGVTPPDTVGDVGPNHYVHAVNTSGGSSIRIYDKAQPVPNVLATFVLDGLPGVPAPCNAGLGDPVVLYDQLADRWLLTEFSSSGNRLCVYVSQTPNPVTGGWFFYMAQAPGFPDYPKYGVWPDAYYVTSNESDNGIYAMDRANMLIGGTARPTQRFSVVKDLVFGFEALTPADQDGAAAPPAGAPAIMMRHKDDEGTPPATADDFLQYWEVRVNWTTPASSTLTGPINIAITDFSSELCGFQSFSCFGQGPANTTPLDPLREVVMYRLAYRNFGTHEVLVGNLVTDADGEGGGDPLERGGVRWFELRKSGASAWALFQEGTFSPDTVPRWMGAIAMDGSGNIAVGYNIAGQGQFASLRYTGRLAADAPGSMRAESVLVAGTAVNSSTRYGDYAQLSIDPADDCTFWFTGEYNPAAQWRTRLGAFKFNSCGNAVPANTAVFTPSLQAPACMPTGRSCDSAALLNGRDTMSGGSEPNQPNTIADSCADGGAGAYHVRESVDRLKVETLDGTQMGPGKTVRVTATVWGFKGPLQTGLAELDLYRADNANAPVWTHFATIPAGPGANTLTATYTLTGGTLQAIRARFGFRGPRPLACATGPYDDHDDLVFAVQ